MNYFFDSSALVKLYHSELGSQRVAGIFGEPGRQIIISRLAGVELHSALALKTRTGHLMAKDPPRSACDFLMTSRAAPSPLLRLLNSTIPWLRVSLSDAATGRACGL